MWGTSCQSTFNNKHVQFIENLIQISSSNHPTIDPLAFSSKWVSPRACSGKSWIVANKFQLSIHSPRDSCLVLQYELNEHSRAIALIRFEQQWRMDQWNILKKTSAIEFIEFSLNWKNVHWIKHTKTIYANEHFCEITARKLQLIRGYQCDLVEAIVELYQEF